MFGFGLLKNRGLDSYLLFMPYIVYTFWIRCPSHHESITGGQVCVGWGDCQDEASLPADVGMIMSLICSPMSVGWSPTASFVRPGRSIRVMFSTRNRQIYLGAGIDCSIRITTTFEIEVEKLFNIQTYHVGSTPSK